MKVVCFVFLLLLFAVPLAQAGEIHGRVLNQNGGAVTGSFHRFAGLESQGREAP